MPCTRIERDLIFITRQFMAARSLKGASFICLFCFGSLRFDVVVWLARAAFTWNEDVSQLIFLFRCLIAA